MRTRRTIAARPRPCKENGPSNRVPNAGGDQRRNGFDRVADREVRRSPYQIDRRKRQRQLDGVGTVAAALRAVWIRREHGSASYVYHLFAPQLLDGRPAAAIQGQNLRRAMVSHNLTF